MTIYTLNLPVCNSGQYTYVMGLCNFFFLLQDLIDRVDSYFQRIAFRGTCFLLASNTISQVFSSVNKQTFTGMVLHKLERRNHGGKSPVNIKYQNPHSFKKGLILLYQSILETRGITHLHGSAHFTIPLNRKFYFFKRKYK